MAVVSQDRFHCNGIGSRLYLDPRILHPNAITDLKEPWEKAKLCKCDVLSGKPASLTNKPQMHGR